MLLSLLGVPIPLSDFVITICCLWNLRGGTYQHLNSYLGLYAYCVANT